LSETLPLSEWLDSIGAVAWTGDKFGLKYGPLPFKPDASTVRYMKPALRCYGQISSSTIYADRTISIGFNLQGQAMQPTRKKMPLFRNGVFVGALMAPYQIKAIGVKGACRFCPALLDTAHTPACARNREDAKRFELKRTRKAAQAEALAAGKLLPRGQTKLATLEPGEIPEGRRAGDRDEKRKVEMAQVATAARSQAERAVASVPLA
jgi:hypothetical protein